MGTRLFITSITAVVVLSITSTAAVSQNGVDYNADVFLQLLRRVENLEKRDQQQQVEIDMLRGDLNTEKQRTSMLEGKLVRLQMSFANRRGNDEVGTTFEGARTAPGDEAEAIQQNRHDDSGDGKTVRHTRSVRSHGEESTRIRRPADMPVIAFHATLTADSLHTGVHQSIAFDHVITNIGAAYNPHVGTFIAPVAGVYVFHTTIMVDMHHETRISLDKNGVSVGNLYIRGVESAFGSDSAMVVLHLTKGDDVTVQNTDADKNINGDHCSMFSGFLLYQDNAHETIVGRVYRISQHGDKHVSSAVLLLSITSAAAVSQDGVDYNNDVYQQLLQRIENLENRDLQQQQEIDALREELTTEKYRTAVLERNLAQLQMKCAERPGNDEAIPVHVSVDASTEAAVDGEEAMTQHQPNSGEGETTMDVHYVKSQEEAPSRIQRHADMPVIAFHATLTSASQHTGIHQSIAFDNTITNIGAAYNPHVGSFVAPVTGVYVFHTTIMAYAHHSTHASIVKNGASIANLYIRGTESIYGSDSAMAVVHLSKGDDVMVHNLDADKSLSGGHYNMFSGFLLYPENAVISVVG